MKDLKQLLLETGIPNIIELIELFGHNNYPISLDEFKFKLGKDIHQYIYLGDAYISPNGYILFVNEKVDEIRFLYYIGEEDAEHLFRIGNISLWLIRESRAHSLLGNTEEE